MASLTTILRLSQALVVSLLVALAGSRGDARHDAARVVLHAGQIAVAQWALSSAPPTTSSPRTWRVNRPPPMLDLAVPELESDELDGDDEGSPASERPSVHRELRARSKDVAGSRRAAPVWIVVSHWMPTVHPRGPPAARRS
jgi:hypothetical protein